MRRIAAREGRACIAVSGRGMRRYHPVFTCDMNKIFRFGFICPILLATSSLRGSVETGALESYGKLPLSFEANQGQAPSEVKFMAHGNGYSLFLTAGEAVLSPNQGRSGRKEAAIEMKLEKANPSPRVIGLEELPGRSNYLIGNDSANWHTNVANYAKVRYERVYPGIDLVYYGNQRQLEYDFILDPGADPRAIHFAFNGKGKAKMDREGDLLLETDGNEFRLRRPVVYQNIAGTRHTVSGRFVLQRGRRVGFEVGAYDSSKPLIIDPVLAYSTYLGGAYTALGNAIAVDASGSAYITGGAGSSFPTSGNAFQTTESAEALSFITKLNPAGSALEYSTYLGGEIYPQKGTTGYGIAVDSSGNAYITGTTSAWDFPITATAFQKTLGTGLIFGYEETAFVTKLNATGSALIYSTFLGGTYLDEGRGIAVDSAGNAYVTGDTYSADFPTANAFQPSLGSVLGNEHAFVTVLNPAGSGLVYSTYLGGKGGDSGYGIAVDASGSAYVTGVAGPNFPLLNAFQATPGYTFVTKFNASGSPVYSTYFGDNSTEASAIALDAAGDAYVTGHTSSSEFPVTPNAFQTKCPGSCYESIFVTKFNAAGSSLLYSTFLGGSTPSGYTEGLGIAVDSSGNAYVTGYSSATDFPVVNAFKPVNGVNCVPYLTSCPEVIVTKLNATGSALIWSTYLGGSGDLISKGDKGLGIAVDSFGNAYVTGYTSSFSFPTANALQPLNAGSPCTVAGSYLGAFCISGFVSKISVPAGAAPPQPKVGGVVNGASYVSGAAVAPGSIISIFGSNLGSGEASASTVPLFTTLLDTSVTINGVPVPLYYVGPGQINAQVPLEMFTPGTASVVVTVNGVSSSPFTFKVAAPAPGIFYYGTGRAVAINPDGSLNGPSAPAKPGDVLIVYLTGQGEVTNPVVDSAPGQASPLSQTVATTTVKIGGTNATVFYSGLAPDFVGLMQLNVQVPTVAAGDQPMVVTIGGAVSNSELITVASH